MPVEIKELVIRAVADESASCDREKRKSSTTSDSGMDNADAIISACVREVMRILEKSRER